MIAQFPILRLKKWNATRWLGRSTCLQVFCQAYEYILDHVKVVKTTGKNADTKKLATELYDDLTTYDNFLFFFFYQDIAERLKLTSKSLQRKDIEISDVGRLVISLSNQLKENYPEHLFFPQELTGFGYDNNIIRELFGETDDFMDRIFPSLKILISIEIKSLEEKLYQSRDIPQSNTTRTTQKKDISSVYSDIMSKRAREELEEKRLNSETESQNPEVITTF